LPADRFVYSTSDNALPADVVYSSCPLADYVVTASECRAELKGLREVTFATNSFGCLAQSPRTVVCNYGHLSQYHVQACFVVGGVGILLKAGLLGRLYTKAKRKEQAVMR
jgi:hypothetical protein